MACPAVVRSAKIGSDTEPAGLRSIDVAAALALFLNKNLRARLLGPLDDEPSFTLILDMDRAAKERVEWIDKLDNDRLREGSVVSSGSCCVLSSGAWESE